MSKKTHVVGAVFERYEKKYRLNEQQYHSLMEELGRRMEIDQYGLHTICTLYYDTDDFAVIRQCLTKPQFKEKLRLRSYGIPRADSIVYLELKKKLAGITYKRRIAMHHTEATDYMWWDQPPELQGQIFKEIDWYKNQKPLSGKAVICYDRIALFGKDDPQFRVTIDANIRWRDYNLALDKGDGGALLLPRGQRLMEIKTLAALPYWMSRLLSAYEIYPSSFSKYGSVYSRFLCGKEAMRYAG